MIIAIDGPAGSGKSTTARIVAEKLGFLYLDTGAMYRAVALSASRSGEEPSSDSISRILDEIRIDIQNSSSGLKVMLNSEDVTDQIRTSEISTLASRISTYREVREKLVSEQRRIATEHTQTGGGVVLEGRDVGTVVFPNAEFKFYLEADPGVRAQRRRDQLVQAGHIASLEDVLAEIDERDRQDSERALAPLRKAEDAIVIDTTRLSIEEQVDVIMQKILERAGDSTV